MFTCFDFEIVRDVVAAEGVVRDVAVVVAVAVDRVDRAVDTVSS